MAVAPAVPAQTMKGDNQELRKVEPTSFRFSLLRVLEPATPIQDFNTAESHFKPLDTRLHGLNGN